MSVWIWVIVTIACLLLEFITTGDLITIWFAISGLITVILSLCGVSDTIQVVTFVVVAFVLLVSLRKVVAKILYNNNETTNIDSIIGKNVVLLSAITETEKGTAKIGDIIWNCISEDSKPIDAGQQVQIIEISGTKLIVKKI